MRVVRLLGAVSALDGEGLGCDVISGSRFASGWAFLTAAIVLAATVLRPHTESDGPQPISDTFASLLDSSEQLGASQAQRIELTVALRDDDRPDRLQRWAAGHGLSVRWHDGHPWAVLGGRAADVATALHVRVLDYRRADGQRFYASPQQPVVPGELRDSVAGFGRILSYVPHRDKLPPIMPLQVPDHSLPPDALRATYNIQPLTTSGYTGKGGTVVVFAFDGFDQADLDMFTRTFDLPAFAPDVVGGMPAQRTGEASMDLQVAHAIAPDARKVLVNARSTVQGGSTYPKVAELMEEVDRLYPGAVWTLSIGWGCDRTHTAADMVPVRSAIAAAQRHGTTVFDASGDLAGLECKVGHDWSAPPGPADVGLDAVASLPEVTSVGGTSLSTDANYRWLGEQAWTDPVLTLGSGGGVSSLFDRPSWQNALSVTADTRRRLTPDISAVADSMTGAAFVVQQTIVVGGGTSQAAPLWAGIAAVVNQFLRDNGGRALGDLNPVLYRLASGAARPGFHDITLGTNAVAVAGPGFDMVTGLGSPDVDNLARNILDLQRGTR